LNARIDALSANLKELIKTLSEMRVNIAKPQVIVDQLQISAGQPPVEDQRKSPDPSETKGGTILDKNS
jgi:hypothetical protein